jgi:hypothetical protein
MVQMVLINYQHDNYTGFKGKDLWLYVKPQQGA